MFRILSKDLLKYSMIFEIIHTSDYDKRDDFGFPLVNFPWLSGDAPSCRLQSYGIFIFMLIRFARCCTSFLLSIQEMYKSYLKCWHRVTDITYFEKHLGFFQILFWTSSKIWCNTVSRILVCNKENLPPGLLRWFSWLFKKVLKCSNNFISRGKLVKPLRQRHFNPRITRKTLYLAPGPYTTMYIYGRFIKRCTPNNKATGLLEGKGPCQIPYRDG